jgi:hypothetical protein
MIKKNRPKIKRRSIMEYIDVTDLEFIGSGVTGQVYKLSQDKVIKVYCNASTWYYEKDSDLIALTEEIDAGLKSKWVLPVEDAVIAKIYDEYYHAAIKKYIPNRCSWKEINKMYSRLPEDLSWDLHDDNVRKDENGRLWLIDSHDRGIIY